MGKTKEKAHYFNVDLISSNSRLSRTSNSLVVAVQLFVFPVEVLGAIFLSVFFVLVLGDLGAICFPKSQAGYHFLHLNRPRIVWVFVSF